MLSIIREGNPTCYFAQYALYSGDTVNPNRTGKRRDTSSRKELNGKLVILNSHLPIANSMMDPDTNLNQFRAFLDKHIFFWPTLRNCQKMIGVYGRGVPNEELKRSTLSLIALSLIPYYCIKKSSHLLLLEISFYSGQLPSKKF